MLPGRLGAGALLAIALATCAASPEEPAPPPPSTPPPAESPASPPAPAPASSDEALALLRDAAKAQGTAELTGEKAVRRFLVRFEEMHFLDPEKGNHQLDSALQAFAAAEAGGKDRLRSEGSVAGERTVLGHSGRVGWMLSKGAVRRFTDRDRDAADLATLGDRRRMLRLAMRVFFLGNLLGDPVPLKLLPDEMASFPRREGKPLTAECRVLERAADPESGDPAIRVHLRKDGLDPVAATFLPGAADAPGWLLVLQYDPRMKRKDGAVPAGMRVPDWIELFEVPPGEDAKPVLRVQASVDGLEIGAERVLDALFEVPRTEGEKR